VLEGGVDAATLVAALQRAPRGSLCSLSIHTRPSLVFTARAEGFVVLSFYSHPTISSCPQRAPRGPLSYMLNTRRGRINHDILFRLGLFYEYSNLEYVRTHVIYRVDQAEYDIRILVVAPQKYVKIYSQLGVRCALFLFTPDHLSCSAR